MINKSNTASNFWLNSEFSSPFFVKTDKGIDYAKLASSQRAIANFVNIVTGKSIPVVFQNNDQSYTDGKVVTIGTKLDGTNFDPAVGLALHEGSHIAYTDFSLFCREGSNEYTRSLSETNFANIVRLRGLDPNLIMSDAEFSVIKDLLNWIEDRRIDYKVYTTAPGYRIYYESMYDKYFNDKIIDKTLKLNKKNTETLDDYMFHIINLTNINRNLNALIRLRDIWNVIDLKNIQRLTSTTDCLDVACDVFKIIKEALATNINQSNSDSDSQSENGDSDSQSENGDSDSQSENGDFVNSIVDYKELKKLESAIQKQRDFLNSKSSKVGKLSKSQLKKVNDMKDAGVESRDVATGLDGVSNIVGALVIKKLTPNIICSLRELFATNSYEYVTGKYKWETDINNSESRCRYIKQTQKAVDAGIILGKQLGKKLQLRNSDRILKSTRLETGKIDKRLIAQLGYNNINVFHRIVTDRFKKYFIHISIDASGSMSGNKFHNAITSAVAVAQAASMTTGIRVQISLRGTSNLSGNIEKAVTIYAYDSALDKMSKIKNLFKYLDVFGCTPEGISFKSIEQDIKRDAKGDECIFVNYSDGAPTAVSGTNNYDGVYFTKLVINGYRELNINIISYFISTGASHYDRAAFILMYGADASFIQPTNMNDVSRTLNSKFLEIVN